jgi:hypothetical protein
LFEVTRRILVCLAFATCCFLNSWAELGEGEGAYFARYDPLYTVVIPDLCWMTVLTLGMLAVWEACRRWPPKHSQLIHRLFLACCIVPLGIASVATLLIFPYDLSPIVRKPWFWPAALLAAAAPVVFAALRPRTASRFMQALFLYSWPVLAIVLIQAARGTLLKYPHSWYTDGPPRAALGSPPREVRVIWIIFDELSETIAFGKRPAGLLLPNLDRLRAQSFSATAATAPGDRTETSLPSLILGEVVLDSDPQGPNNLMLKTAAHAAHFAWSSAPNVFDTARRLGFNTALVGWYHPYGRLLNQSLTKCYWTAGWLVPGIEERLRPLSLPDAMWDRAKLQFVTLPLIGHVPGIFPGVYHREAKRRRFSYLLDRAHEIVADPSIGLALIHLPIPHPPGIYDRRQSAFTANASASYLDNMALVDRTLGELRSAIERAGLWDRTAMLVSADHGWRTKLWRVRPEWTAEEEANSRDDTSGVPFLLKLPAQNSAVSYGKPFNTVITCRIITEILDGRLVDPAGIRGALER